MNKKQVEAELKRLGIPVVKGMVRKSDVRKILARTELEGIEEDIATLSKTYWSIETDFAKDAIEDVFNRLKEKFLVEAPEDDVERVKEISL